jgi:uncharacterized protein
MRTALPAVELLIVVALIKLLLVLPELGWWLVGAPSAGDRFVLAAWAGDTASVDEALRSDLRARLRDGSADTALASAAMTGQTFIVARLLNVGANINSADQFGATPLMYAAMLNRPETARLLLSRGANVEMRLTTTGRTAMQIAANSNAPETADVFQKWSRQHLHQENPRYSGGETAARAK